MDASRRPRRKSTSEALSCTLITVLPSAASCVSRPKLVPAVVARDLPSSRSRVDETRAESGSSRGQSASSQWLVSGMSERSCSRSLSVREMGARMARESIFW